MQSKEQFFFYEEIKKLCDTNEKEVKSKDINNNNLKRNSKNTFKLSTILKINNLKQFVNMAENGQIINKNNKYYLDNFLINKLKQLLKKNQQQNKDRIKINELLRIFTEYTKKVLSALDFFLSNKKNLIFFKKYFNLKGKDKKEILKELGFLKKTNSQIKKGRNFSLVNMFFFKNKMSILNIKKLKFDNEKEFNNFFDNLLIEKMSNIENIFEYNKEKLKNEEQEFIQSIIISDIINYNNNKIFNNEKEIEKIILRNIKYVKFKNFNEERIKNNIHIIKKMFINNKEWINSGIKQGKLVKKYLSNKKEKYYIYEQNIFLSGISKYIIDLIKKEKVEFINKKFNINKWNPSDIYILSTNQNIENIKNIILNFKNIHDLNNYIKQNLINKKIIPLSLKKIESKMPFYMLKNNLDENKKELLNKIDLFKINNINLNIFNNVNTNNISTKFNKLLFNKYIKLISINNITNGISFEMRTYNDGYSFSGEIGKEKSNARHGKIGEGPIFYLTELFINYQFKKNKNIKKKLLDKHKKLKEEFNKIKTEKDMNLSKIILLYKNIVNKSIKLDLKIDNQKINKELTTKDILLNLNLINKNHPVLKEKEEYILKYIDEILEKELKQELKKIKKSYNDWFISKYKSMSLTYFFMEISEKEANLKLLNILLSWLYLYASSQLDISAPYMKSFENKELLRELLYYSTINNIDISEVFDKKTKYIELKIIKYLLNNKLLKNKEDIKMFLNIYKEYGLPQLN